MKKNIIFAACILLLAAVLAVVLRQGRTEGGQAMVRIVGAQEHTISLAEDKIYTFDKAQGAALPVTLEVADGQIRFIQSQCPDHVCENFGWLRYTHDEAICLPAGVVVAIEREAAVPAQ